MQADFSDPFLALLFTMSRYVRWQLDVLLLMTPVKIIGLCSLGVHNIRCHRKGRSSSEVDPCMRPP